MNMISRNILLTGSNRGLGLEFVKQLVCNKCPPQHIFATCRQPNDAKELLKIAEAHPNIIKVIQLDVKENSSYEKVVAEVASIVGSQGLNLLINNAGVAPRSTRINSVTKEQFTETLLVNTISPVMLTKACLPLLKSAATSSNESGLSVRKAAVLNMSSILGSIKENNNGGLYPYRASKVGLNAITKSLSIDLKSCNILVTSLHPGWVQTNMGGSNADLTTKESVSAMLKTAQILNEEHNGMFVQYDGKFIDW